MASWLFACVLPALICQSYGFEESFSMPVVNVTEPDTYLCYAVPTKNFRKGYMVGYKVDSLKEIAHHISIAICESCARSEEPWDCRKQQGHIGIKRLISVGGKEGFQNEHAKLEFPKDIGIELGEASGMKYILLQVHYKQPSIADSVDHPAINVTLIMTEKRRPFLPQKVVLVSDGYIPKSTMFSSELAMRWTGQTVVPYSYIVHVHNYGVMVEGYLIKNGTASLIGRQRALGHANPTYSVEKNFSIEYGDVIAARCIFNNNETFPVKFGPRNQDEMCNFGIDFKYRVDDSLSYPLPIVVYQNAQNMTWCSDRIHGTRVLCDTSKILDFNVLNNM